MKRTLILISTIGILFGGGMSLKNVMAESLLDNIIIESKTSDEEKKGTLFDSVKEKCESDNENNIQEAIIEENIID